MPGRVDNLKDADMDKNVARQVHMIGQNQAGKRANSISYESQMSKVPKVAVMVNFMCQLEWPMGCPPIQLNIILGLSVRVFLDEANF